MKNRKSMKNNPFEALHITIKPKALFQSFSYEANQVALEKRIVTIAKIYCRGYDLNEVVMDYLESKDSIDDNGRKDEIIQTINQYTCNILDDLIDRGSNSPRVIKLYKTFIGDNEEPDKLNDSIIALGIVITEKYSIRNLLVAYIENSCDYQEISYVTGVDFDKDIRALLLEKDEREKSQPIWKYAALYTWFKDVLIPDIRNNNIRYWHPSLELPATQISNVLIKKYLPVEDHEMLKGDSELRKERLYEFAEKVIRVLWLDEPLFEEPVYLVRNNHTGKSASEIDYLYENHLVSICIQEEETTDQTYFNALTKGFNPPYNNKLSYIKRFVTLLELVKEQDVLVIATYLGKDPIIGLIKKGTDMSLKEGEGYKLYYLKLKSVYCTPSWGEYHDSIDLRNFPILKSIIPQQVTISAVKQRKNAIYGIYYGVKYPLHISSMTDATIENLCTEWLRSRFAEETIRISYQLLKTGGNFADVDILGANRENKLIAAQVSNTKDLNLVRKKIDKLKSFHSDLKIMFSMVKELDSTHFDGCLHICIEEVWNDFYADTFYRVMLEQFTTL